MVLTGVSISATWPTVLTWIEEHATQVTGRIASLLLLFSECHMSRSIANLTQLKVGHVV